MLLSDAGSGPGNAIGPGSWPPAICTSAATRASTGGWVSKILENPSRGLSMHISITAEVASGSSPRPSILRSAEIIASGFLVSSTEPASARYSRLRESAKRMTIDSIQATAMRRTAMRIATPAPLRSPLSRPPRQRNPPWNSRRKTSSAKNAITPAMITAITSMHVAVADVGQLVAEHRLDLCIVERNDEARGDRDRILFVVHPRGEGVEAVIF